MRRGARASNRGEKSLLSAIINAVSRENPYRPLANPVIQTHLRRVHA